MNLPPELLQAVSVPGGGKITIVVGAGCSLEAPTSIPLAGTCSEECHDRLVANGVLVNGDCPTPWDLSILADTVVEKLGHQQALVEQLYQNYPLKAASPNEGHLLAAALMGEGVITSVVTLNFDLAITTAIGELGVGEVVGIIDGPDDFKNQKGVNLYYLHRNVNAADPETWILRTAALETEWKGKWEAVVTAKVLATPIVVFAGLGSPASVLVESTKLIQNAMPNGNRAYQIDPGDPATSEFFKALALPAESFVKGTWCDFMDALSQRLVIEHLKHLSVAADTLVRRDGIDPEDINGLLVRLNDIGLLNLGCLRANWLLHEKRYLAEEPMSRELIADLLLATALIARATSTIAVIFESGIVEFKRDNRIVSCLFLVSGRGSRGRVAIEGELSSRRRRFRTLPTPPTGAIVAGLRENGAAQVTPPADVVLGDATDSIVFGSSVLPIYQIDSIRQDNTQCQKVAP